MIEILLRFIEQHFFLLLLAIVMIARDIYHGIKEKAVGHCLYMTILLIMTILIAIWHYNRIDFFF